MDHTQSFVFTGSIAVAVVFFFVAEDVAAAAKLFTWRPELLPESLTGLLKLAQVKGILTVGNQV